MFMEFGSDNPNFTLYRHMVAWQTPLVLVRLSPVCGEQAPVSALFLRSVAAPRAPCLQAAWPLCARAGVAAPWVGLEPPPRPASACSCSSAVLQVCLVCPLVMLFPKPFILRQQNLATQQCPPGQAQNNTTL